MTTQRGGFTTAQKDRLNGSKPCKPRFLQAHKLVSALLGELVQNFKGVLLFPKLLACEILQS